MEQLERPLPHPLAPEAKPYWEGLKQNKLMLPKCNDCGKTHFYPRILCPHCKKPDARGRYHPVGCTECGSTGYKGRTGVYELMVVDERAQSLIHNRGDEQALVAAARAAGLRSMREDGERLVRAGITSPEEVIRVTRD